MRETRVRSLGQEDPLEKEMATHSSTLAWKIPWTEEPGGYSPWGHKASDTSLCLGPSWKRCLVPLFAVVVWHWRLPCQLVQQLLDLDLCLWAVVTTVTVAPAMLMSTQRGGGGRKEMMSSYCYDKNKFDFADPLRGSQQPPRIHAPYFHNCHSKFWGFNFLLLVLLLKFSLLGSLSRCFLDFSL